MRLEVLTLTKMSVLVFWAVMPCAALKMEVVCSSKMMGTMYKSTQHYNPEDQHKQCDDQLKHIFLGTGQQMTMNGMD
jgi:hypothetical protein